MDTQEYVAADRLGRESADVPLSIRNEFDLAHVVALVARPDNCVQKIRLQGNDAIGNQGAFALAQALEHENNRLADLNLKPSEWPFEITNALTCAKAREKVLVLMSARQVPRLSKRETAVRRLPNDILRLVWQLVRVAVDK
ncbi:hypothetical protein BASA81_005773 [Batrachochytrium salamandrivorans]|nr:hypothetical protein BASA81_005773 [Batrachochytrium salamandrivorans]